MAAKRWAHHALGEALGRREHHVVPAICGRAGECDERPVVAFPRRAREQDPHRPTRHSGAGSVRQPPGSMPPGMGSPLAYGARVNTNVAMSRWLSEPSSRMTAVSVSPLK